jgi:epoxyqueuosine reductase QueG
MRAAESLEPDFLQRKQWPNLEALSHLDDAEWDALTPGSAIRRTGIEGMRRNAQINLENQER